MAHQGGVKQYDSKRDKYLKDYYQNVLKKQKDKGTSRFHTESNRQPNNSSVLSLNQSIQLHQRPSMRQNQLNRVYTQNQYPDKSMSPHMHTRLQNTPKNKREGGVSLPKLDSTNSNLQKPVTREQLLQFLDQIMFAVENVQYIVSQYENPPSEIYQSQPVRQMAKFKITQEQQTDHSYIQSQLKSKQQYVNKVNKKTQTPNKQMRANSQIVEQHYINKKTTKIKTEFTEESDGTEKRPTRFPNIVQSSQKQKLDKILPQNRKNRVQSQVISFCYGNQKEDELIQKENTNKQISSNQTQQNSDQSNIIYESSQQNQTQNHTDLKNKRHVTPQNNKQQTYLVETQKKQQRSPTNSAHQLQKTNQNAMIIQHQNKQEGNQSIQQISSNRYSLSDFEDGDPEILLSKSSFQDQQMSQKKQVNAQKTPKVKKRPIQIKNTNQNDINNHDQPKQFDQKTIEMRQNNNEQSSKPQQLQANSNQGDYEFSNEFLSEQTKQLTKNSSNTQNKQQINKLSQKQNSSKNILQINPNPEFYPDNAQKQEKQHNNKQNEGPQQNPKEEDKINKQNQNKNSKEKIQALPQNQHQNQNEEDKKQQQNQQQNQDKKDQVHQEDKLNHQNQKLESQAKQIDHQDQQEEGKMNQQKDNTNIEIPKEESSHKQPDIKQTDEKLENSQISQKSQKNQQQIKIQQDKQQLNQSNLSQSKDQQNSKNLASQKQNLNKSLDEQSEVISIVKSIYVKPHDLVKQQSDHQSVDQLAQNEEINDQQKQSNKSQNEKLGNNQEEQFKDKLSNQQLNLKSNEDLGKSQLIHEIQSDNKVEKKDNLAKTQFQDNQSNQIKLTQTGFKFQPKSLQQSGAYQIIFDKDKYKNKEKEKSQINDDDKQNQHQQISDQNITKNKKYQTQKSLQIIGSNQEDSNQNKNIKSQNLNDNQKFDEEFLQLLNKNKKNEQNNQITNQMASSQNNSKQQSNEKLQKQEVTEVEPSQNHNLNQQEQKDIALTKQRSQHSDNNDSLRQSQLNNKELEDLNKGDGNEQNKIPDEGLKQSRNPDEGQKEQKIQENNNSQIQDFQVEKMLKQNPQEIDKN
ncbi:unnamed protein product (macronuclear) [Paramecium tetraurelia]|uniref:Uncharacterized protein n=1 Tax=Paramecium tetraurelia TaxID=5888 RepID=A0DKC0_PARTE|nr:uncharacterized protein GSPATT00017816001 [Paramecium tetraurelia]CAK83487.1 unnamed protein product [Paramecium tetraurelia]|eukprot:XP_001450884.1 hypothetical protein (macronuclear) [Paramecium tetraurelia strain d4-2]